MKYPLTILSLLTILVFTGCKSASVSLQALGSTSHANWQGNRTYQVLVVGYAYDTNKRIAFENEMVHSLRRVGINASPSHEVYPLLRMIHTQSLSTYLNNGTDKAVLFAHAIAVTQQAYNMVDPINVDLRMFGSNHKDWQIKVGAIVEAALYVNDMPHSVWLNRMKLQSTLDDAPATDSIQAYVSALMTSLRQQTVLSRLK